MDLISIVNNVEKLTNLTKSTEQKQRSINVSDVWHGWDLLVMKYDTREIINALYNFINDNDLKPVIKAVLEHIEKGISQIENMLLEYAIPLPPRPPEIGNIEIERAVKEFIEDITANEEKALSIEDILLTYVGEFEAEAYLRLRKQVELLRRWKEVEEERMSVKNAKDKSCFNRKDSLG